MSRQRALVFVGLAALLCLGVVAVRAQERGRPGADPFSGLPDLTEALRQTEGCLGVETARTSTGKNVIFAWFEDKEAVRRRYYSEVHKGAMQMFFPDRENGAPLMGVADDIGPVMAIASITFSDRPHFEDTQLPISQIAIELYTPLKGGIHLGGTFAPDGLAVEDLRDLAAGE